MLSALEAVWKQQGHVQDVSQVQQAPCDASRMNATRGSADMTPRRDKWQSPPHGWHVRFNALDGKLGVRSVVPDDVWMMPAPSLDIGLQMVPDVSSNKGSDEKRRFRMPASTCERLLLLLSWRHTNKEA